MKIICIDDGATNFLYAEPPITAGKTYELSLYDNQDEDDLCYTIFDDDNVKRRYFKYRFRTIKEERKLKIKKIFHESQMFK